MPSLVRIAARLGAGLIVGLCVLLALTTRTPVWLARELASTPVLAQWEPPREALPVQQPRPRLPPPREAPPAPAQEFAPALPPVEIRAPLWRTRPRHPERFYPAPAFTAGIEGEVLLQCEVDAEGKLSCVVREETPLGWGFGEAALALAGEHVMAPPLRDGAPTTGRYAMRIPFTQAQRR